MAQHNSGTGPSWWRVGAVAGALGVLLGAFGAHGLERIASPEHLEHWKTAADYHLIHALALVAVAAHPAKPEWAGRLFSLGLLLFCGSLYVLALTGISQLGAITPLGGLCFIAGWVALARASIQGD